MMTQDAVVQDYSRMNQGDEVGRRSCCSCRAWQCIWQGYRGGPGPRAAMAAPLAAKPAGVPCRGASPMHVRAQEMLRLPTAANGARPRPTSSNPPLSTRASNSADAAATNAAAPHLQARKPAQQALPRLPSPLPPSQPASPSVSSQRQPPAAGAAARHSAPLQQQQQQQRQPASPLHPAAQRAASSRAAQTPPSPLAQPQHKRRHEGAVAAAQQTPEQHAAAAADNDDGPTEFWVAGPDDVPPPFPQPALVAAPGGGAAQATGGAIGASAAAPATRLLPAEEPRGGAAPGASAAEEEVGEGRGGAVAQAVGGGGNDAGKRRVLDSLARRVKRARVREPILGGACGQPGLPHAVAASPQRAC